MRRVGLLLGTWLLILCRTSFAQIVPGQPGGEEHFFLPDRYGESRHELPDIPMTLPAPRFKLPEATMPAPRNGRLSAGARIVVQRFEIVGGSTFPQDTLGALTEPYLDRPLDSEDLEELRLRLTRLYVDAGYINSGALIPDQEVRAGVLVLQLVEGTLNDVIVSGEHRFDPDYVRERLILGARRPLHVGALQESMQLMLQNPQIMRLNGELTPGEQPGQSLLRVAVTEAPRRTIGWSVANNRSPSVGSDRVELQGALRNMLGRGDIWTLRIGSSHGLDDHTLNFTMPLSARDTQLMLRYDRNNAAVVEAPFDALDIDSRSKTVEIGVRRPVWRTLQSELALGATLSLRESETRLGGEPFSFAAGVRNGHSEVSALRLKAEWLDRSRNHVLSARGILSRGLDAFGSTVNYDGTPDSRFTAALLQAQWVRRLNEAGVQLILRGDVQASDTALLPLEKFSIGGMDTVRGFRENLLIRDRGWSGSAEIRFPVGRLPLPGLSAQPEDGKLSLALFADAGQARDKNGAKNRLWGLGPGIRWDIARDSHAQFYRAVRRKALPNVGDDPQDRGIHFRLVMQKHF